MKATIDLTGVVDIGVPVLLFNLVGHEAGILAALIVLGCDIRRIIQRMDKNNPAS